MKYLFLIILLLTSFAFAKQKTPQLKIAIIDSGLDLNDPRFKNHLCLTGHKDFTGLGLNDTNSHGTHISGIIQKFAGEGNYCFLIFKYFDESLSDEDTIKYEISSIKEAIKNKVKIVNISGGGGNFNEEEYLLIKNNPQIIFVVAAGNNNENIETEEGHYYPASLFLNNIFVVGNLTPEGIKSDSSNWANRPIFWEVGTDVLSYIPKGRTAYATGTSQACATKTGKLIRKFLNAEK